MKYQVKQELFKKQRFGESKHEAKKEGRATEGIYSKQTMENYIRTCTHFAEWCKSEYGCKTLEDCIPYSQAYIDSRMELSSYTLKLDVSALNKLYGDKISIHCDKSRNRADITRTRAYTERSLRAEQKNPILKEFCQATGVRRRELVALRHCDIKSGKNGKLYLQVVGKGGKFRSLEVTEKGMALVKQYQSESTDFVFPKVDANFPVHMYRSDYAAELYKQFYNESDKPIEERNQYRCRGDKKGIVYDRDVMIRVSQNLGHNRESVMSGHYL